MEPLDKVSPDIMGQILLSVSAFGLALQITSFKAVMISIPESCI